MTKSPSGALLPASDEELEKLSRFKTGSIIRGSFTLVRNYKFLCKTFTLLNLCYDKFKDSVRPAEYKGVQATPCFETWRENFIILAGHYIVTFNIRGEIKLKAKSLSFAKCSEEEFEKIYSDLINCALKHVYDKSMTEKQLRDLVEQILRYA